MNDLGRSRPAYLVAAFAVVAAGLILRSHLLPLASFLPKYGGDALWALLIYLLIRFVYPRMAIMSSAAVAFGIAVAVELSQLYRAPWIDAIRSARLGALVLGNTFNWPDIPAYGVGILLGAWIEQGNRGPKTRSVKDVSFTNANTPRE